jgi:hypothetical protein
MEEKNHIYLQRAIQELPGMEPDAQLWKAIESQLDFEQALPKAIASLPLLEPDEDSWANLERHLPAKKAAVKQARAIHLFSYISAAACIVLILVAGLFFLRTSAPKPTLSYSQEMYMGELPGTSLEQAGAIQEALGFIQTSCESQLLVCRTPQFQQLKGQLDELNKEMQLLKQQQTVYGQEPEFIKAQIKLENLQAQITKELIQLIVS